MHHTKLQLQVYPPFTTATISSPKPISSSLMYARKTHSPSLHAPMENSYQSVLSGYNVASCGWGERLSGEKLLCTVSTLQKLKLNHQ